MPMVIIGSMVGGAYAYSYVTKRNTKKMNKALNDIKDELKVKQFIFLFVKIIIIKYNYYSQIQTKFYPLKQYNKSGDKRCM